VKAYLQLALSPQGQAILDAQQDSEKGICRSAGRICWPSAGNWTPCKVSLTARLGTGQGGRYNAAMFIRQGRAVIVLWIACFAILIAALAPTLRAFTVASGQAVPSFEICSVAGGMNMLPVKLSTEAPDPRPGCHAHGLPVLQHARGHLDIPPTTLVLASGEVLTGLLPLLFYQSATPCLPGHPSSPAARAAF
jgi:hypothetical protein